MNYHSDQAYKRSYNWFVSIIYAVLVQYEEVGGKFPWVRDVFCRRFRILSLRGGDAAKALAEQSEGLCSYATLDRRVFLLPAVHHWLAKFLRRNLLFKLYSEIKPEAEDLWPIFRYVNNRTIREVLYIQLYDLDP